MCSLRSTTFVLLGSSLSAMLSSLQDTSRAGWHCPPPGHSHCSCTTSKLPVLINVCSRAGRCEHLPVHVICMMISLCIREAVTWQLCPHCDCSTAVYICSQYSACSKSKVADFATAEASCKLRGGGHLLDRQVVATSSELAQVPERQGIGGSHLCM